jgi:hypothetical protein
MMEGRIAFIKKLPYVKKPAIKPLKGGMTNINYLVLDGNKKYVVRFAPKINSLLGLNRKRESHNTRIAHKLGLGPRVAGFYPKENCLVIEYITGKHLRPRREKGPKILKRWRIFLRNFMKGRAFKESLILLRLRGNISQSQNPVEFGFRVISTDLSRSYPI